MNNESEMFYNTGPRSRKSVKTLLYDALVTKKFAQFKYLQCFVMKLHHLPDASTFPGFNLMYFVTLDDFHEE